MNQAPKVSVIVPVYKAEKYLHRCVDSILAQTFTDFELLLVDDGSPDRSGDICDQYAAADPRVRVFHKPNGGVSSARNLGIANARGKWITFVDADDWVNEDYLMVLITQSKHDDCMSICGIQFVWDNGENRTWMSFSDEELDKKANIGKVLLFGGVACKLLNKKIILERNILFNEQLKNCEDCIFMWQYIDSIERIYLSSYIGYNYYKAGENTSLSTTWGRPEMYLTAAKMLKGIYIDIRNKFTISEDDNNQIQSWISFIFYISLRACYKYSFTVKEKHCFYNKVVADVNNYLPTSFKEKVLKNICTKCGFQVFNFIYSIYELIFCSHDK